MGSFFVYVPAWYNRVIMDRINNFASNKGWIKIIVLLILAAVILFVLLNINYFGKQIGFYFDRTFVTDQQRTNRETEKSVVLEANEIYIASLEIRAPIKYVEKNDESIFQIALRDGVVHYPDTAPVGQKGNTYIFGHSSDFALSQGDYKTVFALLPNIELGAEIMVTDENGKVFRYKVYDKFVAKKTDTFLLDQNTNNKTILTLQTSYPIGTALQRYIVRAEHIAETK